MAVRKFCTVSLSRGLAEPHWQIQDWCPLLRAQQACGEAEVSPAIHEIRKKLWKRADFMTHRKAMAPPLPARVPGWCQTTVRRAIDRIIPFPDCLQEPRREVLSAAATFDRMFVLQVILNSD